MLHTLRDRSRGIAGRASGQAVVELALVAPLVLLMAFGVFEFGRAYHAYSTVIHGAREGARVATTSPDITNKEIEDWVRRAAAPLEIVDVTVTRTPSGVGVPGQVAVRVTHQFQSPVVLIRALWGNDMLPITRTMVGRLD